MTTPRASLPELIPSQFNKELFVNEAFSILEGLTFGGVESRLVTIPPMVINGQVYIVAVGSTGIWSSQVNNFAIAVNGTWIYIQPYEGTIVYCNDTKLQALFNGTTWVDFSSGGSGSSGVSSFNTRTGAVTLDSGDVTAALGFTPYSSANPSGYITSNQTITLSGDITGTGTTSITTTIVNNAVTLSKLSTQSNNTILGNISGSLASPSALTGTEVTTILDIFTRTSKGLVPASGGVSDITKFLREDGIFEVPDFVTDSELTAGLATKQNTLVSGTNIKTINGNLLLGGGNIDISASFEFTTTAVKTSNYTATSGDRIPCDTITTGAFTITLPSSGIVAIFDNAGNLPTGGFGLNNLTVTPSSGSIMGNTSLLLDVGAISVELEKIGAEWRIRNGR